MAKKKFTQLPVADALTGDEIVAVVQSGTSKQTTAQDIADLATDGGDLVDSVTGDGVDNTDSANPIISFPTLSEAILKGGQIDTSRDVTVTGTAVLSIQSDTASLLFLGNGGIELDLGSDADGDMFRRAPGSGQIERRTPAQVLTDIGAQAALGFTPENVANKATDFSTIDNTKYPTVQAVQTEIIARVAGLAWKAPVTCATTANITLSGEQTIDGVSTSAVRVLVKNQSTQSQNGIYVSAAGAWSRASDADTGTELHGATVTVQQGTSNADTTWVQTTDGITIGSSNIVWTQFGSSVPDASSSVKGIAKLYTATGSGTDGAMDQNSATNAIASKVAKGGDTMGGNLAMDGNKVTGLAAATANGDAVRFEQLPPKVIQIACSDETTALTTGTKATFRMPYAMTVSAVRASLTTAQASGSIFTVDIKESGTTILSTLITIDNTEKTSTTAVTAPVISDTALADDAEMTVLITQIGASGAAGLKVSIIGS